MSGTAKRRIVIGLGVLITTVTIQSCESYSKKSDTKEIANTQNEIDFANTKKENDAAFLVSAAEIYHQEIQLAKLIESVSTNKDVKNLAEEIEKGHVAQLKVLRKLAEEKIITIPITITVDGKQALEKIKSEPLNQIEKSYTEMEVKSHKDLIKGFEEFANETMDMEIKEWALNSIDEFKKHLNMAVNIESKI